MGHALVIALLAAVALASIIKPWIGVVCAYFIVVLQPQAVWYWDFGGTRPELWVLIPTGVGVVMNILGRRIDPKILWTRRSLFVLLLWLFSVISYYFGPFTEISGPFRFEDAAIRFADLNKIFVLYFMACLCIDNERKLRVLVYAVVLAGLYLIYWANAQYLGGHYFGRLAGPMPPSGGGVYGDENSFAALFVIIQPFIWYLGGTLKRAPVRWACWLIVPLCWHALFLTASRGGLLGLALSLVVIVVRSKRRLLSLALIPAFLVVFVWQAGSVMRSRADTISDYSADRSAATRLESWHAAARMIVDHPLTGVGLASYGPAFPHYSDKKPREAHDTFLQITAESGIGAGAMYVLIVFSTIGGLWKAGNVRRHAVETATDFLFAANEAVLAGFAGLVVCSLFLSLQQFEVFYCLLVLANGVILVPVSTSNKSKYSDSAVVVAEGDSSAAKVTI
jgi:probable O-glycosylation ligase (exosortase A-associated)